MGRQSKRTHRSFVEITLGFGFLAIAVAVVLARATPATGYEVSIFQYTPLAVWLLLVGVLVVAIFVVVVPTADGLTTVATVLGGTAMLTVVSLPLIRGYHYVGRADALTHLGWVRDLGGGVMDPHTLFYPGYHTTSLAFSRFAGVSEQQAMVVTVVTLALAFFAFVPLTVKLVTGETRAMGFAAIVSWFVLPINNVSTHLVPHINSLTLLYLAGVLFILVLYLRSHPPVDRRVVPTSTGAALGFALVGLVLFHVQHAANLLLVFVGISAAQFGAARWQFDSDLRRAIATHRPLHAQTGLLGVLVGAWFVLHETVARGAILAVRGLYRGDVGAPATLAQRGGSLAEIGGGLPELFVKMFLVSALVGLVTLGYIVATGRGRLRARRDSRALVVYFTIAFIPLTALFFLNFLGTPQMAFRTLGFAYLLVTVLAGMAIVHLADWTGRRVRFGHGAVAVALAVCLVLSLLTVFASPYIYIPSPGVSDQEFQGYGMALDTRADDIPVAGLSSPPSRHSDVHLGTTASQEAALFGAGDGLLLPFGVNTGNPPAAYANETFHVALTKSDSMEEFVVYDGINYDRTGLEAFDTDPNTNRVLANEEFEFYLVTGD